MNSLVPVHECPDAFSLWARFEGTLVGSVDQHDFIIYFICIHNIAVNLYWYNNKSYLFITKLTYTDQLCLIYDVRESWFPDQNHRGILGYLFVL